MAERSRSAAPPAAAPPSGSSSRPARRTSRPTDAAGEVDRLIATVRRRLMLTAFDTNGLGAVVVVAFFLLLFPGELAEQQRENLVRLGIPVLFIFMAIGQPLGLKWILRGPLRPIETWLREGRPASDQERELVLRYPRRWALRSFSVWVVGALAGMAVTATAGGDKLAIEGSATTLLMGGAVSCSLQYLVVERIMRPITAMALAGDKPPPASCPGVGSRLAMAWMLATGVPLLGIAIPAALALIDSEGFDQRRLIATGLFLSVSGLTVGLAVMLFAAKSVAEPLASMRSALSNVEAGDLRTRVAVNDGSEVGLLQAGFNRMTAGLAEREVLRDAFGTFVDPSLTERVLEEGFDLKGEEVEMSLLFMDVRGFTSFAERAAAQEVVARLNDLYGEVVPIVLRHSGHVNKFIGDGLLAIFGAPERLVDHADRAVEAGLEIVDLVHRRYNGELGVGVGVNSGTVIAGTIGGGGRLDFTVIGDAVNTAARVESATRQTGDDLLITDATRRLLHHGVGTWVERPPIELKGKSQAVNLFAPQV